MMTVVKGPCESGKSAKAEEIALNTGMKSLYYIATMKVVDEDGRKRVIKHRKAREGKGFVTLEIPMDIESAAGMIPDPLSSVVLLECTANLTANLMHDHTVLSARCRKDPCGERDLADEAVRRIASLNEKVGQLVVVCPVYDNSGYDDETALFIRLLDAVNEKLLAAADKVYDVQAV